MIEIFDFDQHSDDWFDARKGLPTASKFSTVMAKGEGKIRSEYMRKLAGEIITGEPMDSYSNGHMERGRVMEDEARDLYSYLTNTDPQRVGFIKNGQKGGSPDSLIGDKGGLEIKSALAHIQIERLTLDRLPPEHKAQVHGNLWVSEREWWDFCSYCPKLPLLKVRVFRDEQYIRQISDAVDAFNDELALLVERIRAYGRPREALNDQLRKSTLLAG